MTVEEILARIKTEYQRILGHKLVGIYVHGSLAFGCFRWEKSDIDFLAVVNAPLGQEEKEALIRFLLTLESHCPPKGLEMSVVLESVCKPFQYPTPYELHYSAAHRAGFQQDLRGYCARMQGLDPDLAAHFTVTRAVGIPLYGPEAETVFAPVPREAYLDSILLDVEGAEEEIGGEPVYFILNLCRVLGYLEEGKVLSKAQGGAWGLEHLSEVYHSLLQNALDAYKGRTAAFSEPECRRFAARVLERIRQAQ